ncbi:MAG: GNAT family N-acetyltransferase [Rickettsiales bacterium]|jgi:putative acetyltransferase|nr:GNAT family N-acetyltransferase [Rickettsiales bacterium]
MNAIAAEVPKSQAFTLRPIAPADNCQMADIVRKVMTEFGCTADGFAIHDPELDNLSDAYDHARSRYFVIEVGGKVVGGGGVSPLRGTYQNICELQKFYVLPEHRGKGYGRTLLDSCLEFAREQQFQRCYLETVQQMHAADSLYRKAGFEPITMPLGNTGHHACDRWYARIL